MLRRAVSCNRVFAACSLMRSSALTCASRHCHATATAAAAAARNDGFGDADDDNDDDSIFGTVASPPTSTAPPSSSVSTSAAQHVKEAVSSSISAILDVSLTNSGISEIMSDVFTLLADATASSSCTSTSTSSSSALVKSDHSTFFVAQRASALCLRIIPLLSSSSSSSSSSAASSLSAEEAALCFDSLQRSIEAQISAEQRISGNSTMRLPEQFIRDVCYRVFQSDLPSPRPSDDGADAGNDSASSALSLSAASTASTLRNLVSCGFVHDDYLTGIGLSRCALLVQHMDVPALLHTLEALRRLDRTYFSFSESEYYRSQAQGLADGIDVMVASDNKGERGGDGGGDDDDVFHPNLISVVSTSLESRVNRLIGEALSAKKPRKSDKDEGVKLLPETKHANTMEVDLDDGKSEHCNHPSLSSSTSSAASRCTAVVSAKTKRARADDNDAAAAAASSSSSSSSIFHSFAPLCRPSELVLLIREMCQCPTGVSDPETWNSLATYLRRHNEVARMSRRLLLSRHSGSSPSSSSSSSSSSSPPSRAMSPLEIPLEDVMSLLHVLVKPIIALGDPLDAIIASNSNSRHKELSSSLVVQDHEVQQHRKRLFLPTQPVISELAALFTENGRNSKSIAIIGCQDPDAMRQLRQAFELYPVLFETAPQLWDQVRLAKIPRKTTAQVRASRLGAFNPDITGIDNRRSRLGMLPTRRVKAEYGGVVLSKHFMKGTPDRVGHRIREPGPRQKPAYLVMPTVKNKRSKIDKDKQWSKGTFRATRLAG